MPIVPHHQPTPVVQPAMSTLHLPATRADRVHLRRTAGTLASRPMTLRNRGTNPSSSQFPPELCAVVALVSSQRVRSLLGPASSTRDANPVHHIQSPLSPRIRWYRSHRRPEAIPLPPSSCGPCSPYPSIRSRRPLPLFGWDETSIQEPLAPVQPALFVQGPQNSEPYCAPTLPAPPTPARRRWQVEELPYRSGRSFQRAPERSTQRIPLRVVLSSALGLPRRLGGGRRGAMTSHCSSRRSSSIAQASTPQTWAID